MELVHCTLDTLLRIDYHEELLWARTGSAGMIGHLIFHALPESKIDIPPRT